MSFVDVGALGFITFLLRIEHDSDFAKEIYSLHLMTVSKIGEKPFERWMCRQFGLEILSVVV